MTENRKKILIVEDEKPLANALKLKLEESGFAVNSLNDGRSALKDLHENTYDLIILDILMPESSGWDVLKFVQGKKIIVLITSNLSQEEDIKKALELGAIDFIVKSDVSLSEIVDRVVNLLIAKNERTN